MSDIPEHVKGTRMEAVHRAIMALPDAEYVIVLCIRPLDSKEKTMVVLCGHDDQLTDTMGMLDQILDDKINQSKQRPS